MPLKANGYQRVRVDVLYSAIVQQQLILVRISYYVAVIITLVPTLHVMAHMLITRVNVFKHTNTIGPQPLSSAERWDHITKRWTALPPMHHGRAWHAMVVVPKIGVICAGGIADKSVVLDSVEIYDQQHNAWKVMGMRLHSHTQALTCCCCQTLLFGETISNFAALPLIISNRCMEITNCNSPSYTVIFQLSIIFV
jgi:hypothetical protein